jgi:hypothetical protein
MLFRVILSSLALLCLISNTACKRGGPPGTETRDGVSLNQNVTEEKPKDPIFVDFQNNWRKLISPRAELALPVIPLKKEEQQRAVWQPVITSECVFSQDAGGYVPQVTLTWIETQAPQPGPGITLASQVQQPSPSQTQPQQTLDPSKIRFDLALHFQAFERNQFTSAVASDKEKRFNLPSNSNFVTDSSALLLTGPSLFPKVLDFRAEIVRDRDSNRDVPRNTLVVGDLGQGLAYTLRMSSLGQNQWNETKQVVFTTPNCPQDF